jgi:hypothetical protein
MDEYVRVADKETGHHLSIHKARYDADPDLWRELKSDATYADGTPRPPKYKTDVSTEAAKKSGNQAADNKE